MVINMANALGGNSAAPVGRGRLGSNTLFEPITALDEIELAE